MTPNKAGVMDFFSRQDDIQRKSRIFFIGFGLAVALTVCLLYLALSLSLGIFFFADAAALLSPLGFLTIGSATAAVILFVARRRRQELLNGGGAYVAELLGGVELERPDNLKETQLVNVVEEMAVASGLPRPRIYLLPREPGLNAVTAGEDAEDAVIAVTKGALEAFDRRELQAVMAHEFAHILNGDAALNLQLAGWIYGLVFFSARGKDLAYLGGRGRVWFLVICGAGLWLAGLAGKFSAQLLEAAISRQREHLADAFAAQFTRDPQGLADALKKIGGANGRGAINSGQALAFQSFFIASPARRISWLKTHPPLEDRIFALEPGWNGSFIAVDLAEIAGRGRVMPPRNPVTPRGRHLLQEKLKDLDQRSGFLLAAILAAGGDRAGAARVHPGPDMADARSLLDSIDVSLREATRRPEQAPALAAAVFLLDEPPEVGQKQLDLIEQYLGPEARALAGDFKARLQPALRLPILDLAAPELRRLNPETKTRLLNLIKALIAADNRIDLFEMAAMKILEKHLGRFTSGPSARSAAVSVKENLENLRSDVTLILSAMAHVGGQGGDEVQAAFEAGLGSFSQWGRCELVPASGLSSRKILAALDRLALASTVIKNNLLVGAAACALHDHQVNEREYELLRALAAALDLNLPYLTSKPKEK